MKDVVSGGAKKLASIFATEEDRVNCPFYFKIGACRHGDNCSRLHNKPYISTTVLIPHMYTVPQAAIQISEGQMLPDTEFLATQEDVEDFYEDAFVELSKFGEIEEIIILDNVSEHLLGNVYVKYYREQDAASAREGLQNTVYCSREINPEFCPVTDFKEARCRQYATANCSRGGYCNFMHAKHIPRCVRRRLNHMCRELYRDLRIVKKMAAAKEEEAEAAEKAAKEIVAPSIPARANSRERRAMISQWNKDTETPVKQESSSEYETDEEAEAVNPAAQPPSEL